MKVVTRASLDMCVLHQKSHVSIEHFRKVFPWHFLRGIFDHAKQSVDIDRRDGRQNNKGCSRKLPLLDERTLLKIFNKLQKKPDSFASTRNKEEAHLDRVDWTTIRRVLHRHGLKHL